MNEKISLIYLECCGIYTDAIPIFNRNLQTVICPICNELKLYHIDSIEEKTNDMVNSLIKKRKYKSDIVELNIQKMVDRIASKMQYEELIEEQK